MQRRDIDPPEGDEDPSESGDDVEKPNQQDGSDDDCSTGEDDDDDDDDDGETSVSESQTRPNRASCASREEITSSMDEKARGSSAKRVIAEPFFDDVVGGRGKYSNNHFGNQRYRKLVRENCEEYQNLGTNAKKSRFAEAIVTRVRQDGGRFLKQLPGAKGFVEMDDSESRKKVGQVSVPHLQEALKCNDEEDASLYSSWTVAFRFR